MDIYLQIADAIKKEVSDILMSAVNGTNPDYRYWAADSGRSEFIRWGLVEKDIHKVIDLNLTADAKQ